jgi:hypothetical protein
LRMGFLLLVAMPVFLIRLDLTSVGREHLDLAVPKEFLL